MPIFIPFEFPTSNDGKYTACLTDDRVFFNRRTLLGLTQQDVAKMAGVPLRQYQRLEAGDMDISKSTAKFALSVCAVLLLDPYSMVYTHFTQPDPATLKPQYTFDSDITINYFESKKSGRKPIQRDIMTIYFNSSTWSIIIPRNVLEEMKKPPFIRLYWNKNDKRFLFEAVKTYNENLYDIPDHFYKESSNCTGLAFPPSEDFQSSMKELGWDDDQYGVECRLVKDKNGKKYILCDLKTAKPSESFAGPFIIPSCLDNDDDDDDSNDIND